MPSRHLDPERQQRWQELEYDFDDGFDGLGVLVAGGTGGLGRAVVARLLHDGAEVVIGYADDEERARRIEESLADRYGGRVRSVRGDVTTAPGRRSMVDALAETTRPYGAAVLVGDPARVPPEERDDEAYLESFHVNTVGPLLLARETATLLVRNGVSGSILLTSSMQGVHPFPGSLLYAAPKSALVMAARVLAQDFGGSPQIRVNAVAPGVNAAGMALASIDRGKYDPYVDEEVIPRFGRPEDVARATAFLMAPDNYVTGQCLVVDGGLTSRRGS